MILTLTPNPSIDRTIALGSPLTRGVVHRVVSVSNEPGGKGVNVARALTMAGVDALALLPAAADDPLLRALDRAGVSFRPVPVTGAVRTNIAVTEPDGTTTKLNEPGAVMTAAALDALTQTVVEVARDATWVVMSGSLPPGMPVHWYADVVALLATLDCKVAVDTSDAPLIALVGAFERAAPDLIKPNAEELASLTGGASGAALEHAFAQGDPQPVIAAAEQLVDRGARAVLATLGGAGAVLVDETGAWLATAPPIVPRSTVGAGDSALAGYLRADVAGADAAARLQMAVAYGSAAAALPGSALPAPAQVDAGAVSVHAVTSPESPTPTTKVPHA